MAAASPISPRNVSIFEYQRFHKNNPNLDTSKSYVQIGVEFFKTTMPWKIVNYILQLIGRISPLSATASRMKEGTGIIKNAMNTAALPENVSNLANSVQGVYQKCKSRWVPQTDRNQQAATKEDVLYAFSDLARQFSDTGNAGVDAAKLCEVVAPVKHMKALETTGSFLTFGSSIFSFFTDSHKLVNTCRDSRIKYQPWANQEKARHTINILTSFCYSVVGGLGIRAWLLGIPSPYTLFFLTGGLVCNIASFFFKNIVDPQGQNQDPQKVMSALVLSPQQRRQGRELQSVVS